MNRWTPRIVTLLVVAAMVSPALARPPRDDFPLSTYPMFAVDRGPVSSIATAVGWTADGDRVRLSPRLLAGADEPILAVRTARVAISDGAADDWCAEVATRVAAAGSRAEVERIEVVVETHESARSAGANGEPLAVESHAECPVAQR
jgi:hypothetical protein